MSPVDPRHSQATAAATAALYWQRNSRLTLGLLLIWALATFGGIFFARELNFSFFGWPFSFWVAAQGLLLLYCGLISYYARAARKLDEACCDQLKKDSIAAASASG